MNVETRDGVTIARLDDALGFEAYETLRGPLHALFDQVGARVILDLRKVSRVDSAGWGLLLSVLRRARQQHGQLRLLHLSEHLAVVFIELTLERVFEVFDHEETALLSFRTHFEEAEEK